MFIAETSRQGKLGAGESRKQKAREEKMMEEINKME